MNYPTATMRVIPARPYLTAEYVALPQETLRLVQPGPVTCAAVVQKPLLTLPVLWYKLISL